MAKKRKLPPMTVKARAAYIKNPYRCPYCGSGDISAGDADVGDTGTTVPVACVVCSRTWVETHTLSDVDDGDEHVDTETTDA